MKRIFKYLCIAATAAMSLFPTIANGQDAIYKIGVPATKKTIVREMKENVAIVYSYDGTDGWFSYVDMNTPDCYSAKIPGLEVNDFEIYKDTVYFCGKGGGVAVAGYFDINATFFMGAPAQFATMPYIPCICGSSGGTCTDEILGLRKIEVMENPGGEPHILMTGDATCGAKKAVNRCVIDVYHDGTEWKIAMTQEHESEFYYDDIVVTDNYVVAVGHKHQSSGEYITQFIRPVNPTDNIFTFYMYPFSYSFHQVYSHGGATQYILPMDEEFLIEHISDDIFATICHGGYSDNSGLFMGTVLNIYNTVSSVVNRYYVSDTSSEYKSLKYNSISNSLYLLPGTINSSLPIGYIEYVLDPSFVRLSGVYRHWNNNSINVGSLDAAPKTMTSGLMLGQAIVSSMTTYKLNLWRHRPKTGCSSFEEITPVDMWHNDRWFNMPMWYGIAKLPFNQYYPQVISKDISIICGDGINND